MEIGQILALPCQSLVLSASAWNLVTTGYKARLADRIHALEHTVPPVVGPLEVAGPAPLSVSVDQTPMPVTAFSEMQITQLWSLISATILNKRAGVQQPPGLAVGSLLSPATPQPQPPSAAVQTALQNAQSSQASFADYGRTEMNRIGEQFFTFLPNEDRATSQGKLQAEHAKFMYDLASWKAKIPPECQSNTEQPPEITAMTWSLEKLAKMGLFYEELSFVAEIILLAPVTNVGPERGATSLKRIKARLKSKLGDDMIFSLMHITINGPEIGTPKSREKVGQAY